MSIEQQPNDPRQRFAGALGWLGLFGLAAACVLPLWIESPPTSWHGPYATPVGKVLVVVAVAFIVAIRIALDLRSDRFAVPISLLLMLMAALMAAWHWQWVERDPVKVDWQRIMYLRILDHTAFPPHVFRGAPYGLTRLLEWVTGDWDFACLAYRWFFDYWFLWASYRLARIFLTTASALVSLAPVLALYPISVWYYRGQLTDGMSHALFVLALVYVVENRLWRLAAALALGVLAKETAAVIVVGYVACYGPARAKTLRNGAFLTAVCALAFLAARLPLGWRPNNSSMNGMDALMISTNLGVGWVIARTVVPLYMNYLHPALFFLPFAVVIGRGWSALDRRLAMLCATVPPLVFISSLCFSWLYESRNYLPVLPLLSTSALVALAASRQSNDSARSSADEVSKRGIAHERTFAGASLTASMTTVVVLLVFDGFHAGRPIDRRDATTEATFQAALSVKPRDWSVIPEVTVNSRTLRGGDRYRIWPLDDHPFASRRENPGLVIIELAWCLQPGAQRPGLPDDEGLVLWVGIPQVDSEGGVAYFNAVTPTQLNAGAASGTVTAGIPARNFSGPSNAVCFLGTKVAGEKNLSPLSNLLRVRLDFGKARSE